LKVIKANVGILRALMIPKANLHPLRILWGDAKAIGVVNCDRETIAVESGF